MAVNVKADVIGFIVLIYLSTSCTGYKLEERNVTGTGIGEEIEVLGDGESYNNFAQPFAYSVGNVAIEQDSGPRMRIKRYPEHLGGFDITQWVRVGECPMKSSDGNKLFYCPTLTHEGEHACVDDHQLCNGMKECPNAEDENKNYCLFHKAMMAQVDTLDRAMFNLKRSMLDQLPQNQEYSPRIRNRKYGKKPIVYRSVKAQ